MFYIPYDPKSDPWYQFGQAVAGGLGMLADNKLARGEAKNLDKEFASDEASNIGGFLNQTNAMMKLGSDDKEGWSKGNASLSAMGYTGPTLTPQNAEGINAGLLKQQDYWNNFQDFNRGKRLQDPEYQDFNTYKSHMPGLLG